jgi:peptidoglycan/LPS O-acetylase OafA/YrhL
MASTKQIDPSSLGLPHRPDIDGLRGIAVLAVVLYHFQLGLPGGYLGVDVFFVISGFLITSLILRRIEAGRFTLADFYERRVRRIAPAALVTMAVTLVVGAILFSLHEDRLRLGRAVIAQVLLGGNCYHYSLGQNYFRPAEHDPLPLLHTWSLAVEEQFYILFPLLFCLIGRWRRSWIACVILVLLSASLLLRFLPDDVLMLSSSARFFLLPTRAWELLIGVLIAVVKARPPSSKIGTEILALVAMALMMASFFDVEVNKASAIPSLVTCLGTAVLLLTHRPDGTLVQQSLSLPPLRWLGLISYSLYLVHWPLWVFVQYFPETLPSLWTRVSLFVLSLGLAWLSWRYVETPVRQKRILATRGKLFAAFAVTSVLLLVGGGALPLIYTSTDPRIQSYEKDCEAWPILEYVHTDSRSLSGQPEKTLEYMSFHTPSLIRSGRPEDPPAAIIWGDSHAGALRPVADDLARSHQVSAYSYAVSGRRPFGNIVPADTALTNKNLIQVQGDEVLDAIIRLAKQERIPMVMLVSRWNISDKEPWFEPTLQRTVDRLTQAGLRCVILQNTPEMDGFSLSSWRRRASRGLSTRDLVESLNDYQNRTTRSRTYFNQINAPGNPGKPGTVEVLDPTPFFKEGNPDLLRGDIDGVLLYRDVDHVSPAGARRLRPLLEPYIREAAESVRQRP